MLLGLFLSLKKLKTPTYQAKVVYTTGVVALF